ncbi:MAG: hypothetical protein ACPGSM_19940, partial [Thiolinea sp.]
MAYCKNPATLIPHNNQRYDIDWLRVIAPGYSAVMTTEEMSAIQIHHHFDDVFESIILLFHCVSVHNHVMKPSVTVSSFTKSSLAQRERLAYIEFRLFFLGSVGRQNLIERFGIAPAAATRDFTL